MKPIIKDIAIFLITCSILIYSAYATSDNFDINAGESKTIPLDLNEGDRVSGKVAVVGIESIINFSIVGPNQNIIHYYQNVGSINFQFVVDEQGVYEMVFENLSEESKQITINFDVQHYIFGYPQEYILLFVVVGLAVVAVAIFTLLSPKP